MNPRTPIRADHRLISKIMSTSLSKIEIIPQEVDVVSSLFLRSGGSWVSLYQGSPEELTRLKDIIKFLAKKEFFTKKYEW